jgi:hypothetical protein
MEDPNILLVLTALNESVEDMFRQPHNNNRYVAPPPTSIPNIQERHEREGSQSYTKDEMDLTGSCIRLELNNKPRNIDRGYTFGRDPTIYDIYLPKQFVSKIHFSITFNEDHRLYLVDTSTQGT